MKKTGQTLLLFMICGATFAAESCCSDGELIKLGGYCGNATLRINRNCTKGHFLLKDIFLKGDRLYTEDSPNFAFAEDPQQYCVGEMLKNNTLPELGIIDVAVVCFQAYDNGDIEITGILTLISVIFLLLTIMVYTYLPQLRDLQGLCFMCMCISMAIGFLSLGIVQLNNGFRGEICTVSGFVIYFWMIATFFWMNVVSINAYRSAVDSSYVKKTEKTQFFYYSCYAWGGSVCFLMVALITNFIEGIHLKPGIGHTSCWFKGPTETWIFFYGPIAILVAANVTLFIKSSITLWTHNKKYEVSKLNNLKYKFLLSLKLFLVMGVSWIFEIASFAHGESFFIWKIMDIFNCLQGVVIFLLLVLLRRRAISGLAEQGFCGGCTRKLAVKLNPHDDEDDQCMLAPNDHTEVRLN